jgi:AsmA protein
MEVSVMKRALKWIGIIVAVLVVIVLVLPFVINVNSFRPRIESELTNALGRKVTVGNISLSLWSGSLAAENIAIADDPAYGQDPFIRANSLNVGVEVMPLILNKVLHITDLTLSQPQVTLLRDKSGRWNFSTLGSASPAKNGSAPAPTTSAGNSKPAPGNKDQPSAPVGTNQTGNNDKEAANPASEQSIQQNLSVGKLDIKDGQVTMADAGSRGKAHIYKNVTVSVKNFAFSSQFPFTLSADLPAGGSAKLDGTAGPINPSDAAATPFQAKIAVKGLDLAASGFVDPSSGIAGIAAFDGQVSSDGTQAKSSGNATAEKLKLSPKGTPSPRSVNLRYDTTYGLQKQTGQIQADVSVAKAAAKLSGTYDLRGDSAVLNSKLNADNMPVDDLEAMLPALGVILPSGSSLQGGTLSADLNITGPVDKLVITGPVKLVNTKLAHFDMGSKLSAISALSGAKSGPDTSIQNFSSNVHVAPSGIQTENINLVIPAIGTLIGSGTISPQNALDYKMTANLSGAVTSGLSQLAGLSGKSASIPFFIQGTASDPKFVPDVKGIVGSQLKNQLGSQIPGGQKGQGVVDALGGLFGKKKKQ